MSKSFLETVVNLYKKYKEDSESWFEIYNYSNVRAETLKPFAVYSEYLLSELSKSDSERQIKVDSKTMEEFYQTIRTAWKIADRESDNSLKYSMANWNEKCIVYNVLRDVVKLIPK